MKNINISKVASLIESKKQSNNVQDNQSSNSNKHRSSQAQANTLPDKQTLSFTSSANFFRVTNLPKEKFSLFDKKDFYHYDRKFFLDLPNVVIPPISLHYSHSNENFAAFDGKTMMLGLKKHHEIMTDSRINTKIYTDVMDNTMNLLLPERQKKNILDEKSMSYLKKEVLDIIESQDVDEKLAKNEKRKMPDSHSFYLRKTTIMGSTLNNKNRDSILNYSSNNNSEKKSIPLGNLKNMIEESFEIIENVQEGMNHPEKPGVIAKNVYPVIPFFEFSNLSFSEVFFKDDPIKDIRKTEIIPDKFLLKKENSEGFTDEHSKICSFYKVENTTNSSNDINLAKFFTYQRDFITNTLTNENELFNRNFLFINKDNNIARILPVENKFNLKKFMNRTNQDIEEDEYYDRPKLKKNLNQKRSRSIILIPRELTKVEREARRRKLKEKALNIELKEVSLGEVNWEECEQAKLTLKSDELKFDEEEVEESESLFGSEEDEARSSLDQDEESSHTAREEED